MDNKESGLTYYYYGINANLSKGLNGKYGPILQNVTSWQMGETASVTLDMENHEITWFKDKKKLGTLEIEKDKTYYPAISLVGGNGKNRQEFKLTFD